MKPTHGGALRRERIRSLNQSAVINAIHRYGRISRTDLAAELHLSPAAITSITAPFVEEGLVIEAEVGVSASVGRKPILLGINYDHSYVLGMKVMNQAVLASLTNLNAEVKQVRGVPLTSTDVDSVLDAITELTTQLKGAAGVAPQRVIGLGVSLPGVVDLTAGSVRHSELLGWDTVPLADLLQSRLGLPTLVENDVNALAAAHAWFGHGRDHGSFLVVTVGRGVGLGIVIGGQLYRGPRGGAGELGHTRATPIAPRVMTPATTTLEGLLGDAALLRQARALVPGFGPEDGVEELTKRAANGNAAALDLLADAGSCLGVAIADLVNVFAPTLVILGGEGMRNGAFLLPHVRSALDEYVFGGLGDELELVVDTWGDDAWARGAAGLAAARFLEAATIPLEAAGATMGSD
ncbi:MAG: ROK family transcriptional regulator [Trueperaceae bacterium]|nr:ROK family transcriptional regulator [Trueperaceae bacterium]